VMNLYLAVLAGEQSPLRAVPTVTRIERWREAYPDFAAWCRRGNYLYKHYRTEDIGQRATEPA
jgi:hypothetical protein